MMMTGLGKCLLVLISIAVAQISGHVRTREPPNRSSVWRDARFEGLSPQPNYDDDGLYCEREHQYPVVDGATCGICGDPATDPRPRPNEHGGIYGQGIVTGEYRRGQEIPISVEFTTAHLGFFRLHICDELPETDDCFARNGFLEMRVGSGYATQYPVDQQGEMWANTTAKLPAGLSCRHCVLRLEYRAGNNWGECEDGSEGMGCGLQETFRSCSDISISL